MKVNFNFLVTPSLSFYYFSAVLSLAMKCQYIIYIVALFLFASCNKSTKEVAITDTNALSDSSIHSAGAKITFNEDFYNFGNVIQGELVSYAFSFINNGDEDLIISLARGSCGCTVPTYPKQPIKPGEKGEIDVVFNSENLIGISQKTITILTNSTPHGIYTLTIQSSVIPTETN